MKINNLKSKIIRPDFLDLCELVHFYHEIFLQDNTEFLKLKITLYHPKTIGLNSFLPFFHTLKHKLLLSDWDEQDTYDFAQTVYTDFTFISQNKRLIKKFNSLSTCNSKADYISTLFQLKNIPTTYSVSYIE
jgi:hypothetical protein